MKLKHNIAFVGGTAVPAGSELTKEQEKQLKDSGTKYHELDKKKKTVKDAE